MIIIIIIILDSSTTDALQIPPLGFTLSVSRTPGDAPQGKVRKCSIVQEEEDEEEYCTVVGNTQELTPPHSSLNRRGSRSEGKLNIAIQVRQIKNLVFSFRRNASLHIYILFLWL